LVNAKIVNTLKNVQDANKQFIKAHTRLMFKRNNVYLLSLQLLPIDALYAISIFSLGRKDG
jgi:hypothetical protein